MAKGGSRPAGGRPPGRRGRGGVGPGPGYRPGGTGKGSTHKSSFATTPQQIAAGLTFLVLPLLVVGGLATFFLHGYGVI